MQKIENDPKHFRVAAQLDDNVSVVVFCYLKHVSVVIINS